MKKTVLLLIFSVILTNMVYAQTEKAWKPFTGTDVIVAKSAQRESFPTDFKLMQLDLSVLKNVLASAPDRFSAEVSTIVITIPNVDGKLERYQMYEASNFDAALQARFPEIRSYVGNGLDDKYAKLRLSIDTRGIQTMIFRAVKGTEFMEPYSQNGNVYAVYASKSERKGKLPFTCSTDDIQLINSLASDEDVTSRSSATSYKTFRLALSCNGEYANYFGATSALQAGLVLAQFNATMARVNGVFEKDFAIHMNIVAQSTNVIFYNPATDPYSDALGTWNTELQQTLNTTLTGPSTALATNNAAYDVGHMFGASGGGGNAGCIGCVCVNGVASGTGSTKGRGITSPSDGVPQGDKFDIDYVAHELGHQFGANHTFTHSNEDNTVNYEPGGGTTIMAYAGITPFNLQSNSDDYFHAGSIQQVQTNVQGKTCPVSTPITHSAPVVNAGADYTVPKNTPFMLTGSATDAGGTSSLTYCWEQYNDAAGDTQLCSVTSLNPTGDQDCVPVATKTTGPVFRSYDPTTSPSRRFPKLESTLAGNTFTQGADLLAETLSTVARNYTFRLTARDNEINGGQTNFDDVVVTVANKTALTVSMTANTVYPTGSTQTVAWTGATGTNGHASIAGGATVDILFSADNGTTWTTVLANTTNDNSEAVTLPAGISGAYCRLMVKASGNIFYNISPTFAVGNYTYQNQNVCTDYSFQLNSAITESTGTSYPGISLPISDSYTITDANFYANVTHPNIGQFSLLIKTPWQTALNTGIWYNNTTCTGANLDKWFDTAGSAVNCATTVGAPSFLPFSVGTINGFNGNDSAGSWLIYFKDTVVDSNVSGASFNSFTIQLCRAEIVPVLSSQSFAINDLAIYPNPNNGTFNIQLNSTTGNDIKVSVHDIRGRAIFNKNFANTGLFNESIALNNAQKGIYLVTIEDGNQKEVKKIIVE